MKNKITILLLIWFVGIKLGAQQITDIIQPVNLKAGKTDSVFVEDLFYSKNYDLTFLPSNEVKIIFDKTNNYVKFTPGSSFEGMTVAEFNLSGKTYLIPLIVKKEKYYKFEFKPDTNYSVLTLFGSFNGWNRYQLFMKDENNDGVYDVEVALEPGTYQYKFFADGKEIVDPLNPDKVPNGFGDFNSVITIQDPDTVKTFLHVGGYKVHNDTLFMKFIYETKGLDYTLYPQEVFAFLNNSGFPKRNLKLKKNEIQISMGLDELNGENTFRIAVSKKGKVTNIQTVKLFDGKPADGKKFDWQSGIIYSLMIDRFYDGDTTINNPVQHDSLLPKANYMGGDLEGIIQKIEEGYFDSLGINTLWISPVYDNPNEAYREYPPPHRWFSGYHGYWPISSTRVEEKFGTLEKVKELVNTAHAHGLKVLLDFVSNHVHKKHPFFKKHRNWFGKLKLPDGRLNIRFWDEFRLTTWFEPYLPSFDYLGSQEALDTMTSNAVWWLKTTGADGFRHDAVKHVPNKFWRVLNKKITEQIEIPTHTKVYQIGETFGSYELISSYVNNGQLDAQFNFNLYDVALPVFIKPGMSFETLDKEIHKSFRVYGYNNLMGNIMDSHDKNRFMAYADGDLDVSQWSAIEEGWNNPPKVDNPANYKKLILYMAYMNTIPGIPVVYYGSEFGMTGASDPDNRRMMRFDGQLTEYEKNTLREVSKIIKLRRQHPALNYGDFYTLAANQNIYAFMRSDMNERIIVVLNKSNKPQKAEFVLPSFIDVDYLVNLQTGAKIPMERNGISVIIPATSYSLFIIPDNKI